MIRFSTEAEPLFDKLVDANKENVAKAQDFVGGLKPIGGTAISEALGKAFALAQVAHAGGSPLRHHLHHRRPADHRRHQRGLDHRGRVARRRSRRRHEHPHLLLRPRHRRQHPPAGPPLRRDPRLQPVRAAGRGPGGEAQQLLHQDQGAGAERTCRWHSAAPDIQTLAALSQRDAGPVQGRGVDRLRPLQRPRGRGGEDHRHAERRKAGVRRRTCLHERRHEQRLHPAPVGDAGALGTCSTRSDCTGRSRS